MTRDQPIAAALCDGLDEAARGLWPSAAESFAEARRADPSDPRAPLAEAICLLRLANVREAIVLLEGSPTLNPAPPHLAAYHQWLCGVARMAFGDPDGAAKAIDGLPWRRLLQLRAHERLMEGELHRGVMGLLQALSERRGPG